MSTSSPPRRIVGVSTKMYFSAARTSSYITSLLSLLPTIPSNTDVFIIPDHITLLPSIQQLRAASSPILPGAQDCYSEDAGAYTGEVSPSVLAEVGCRIVELGHAERRRLFAETDASAAAKTAAVVRNGMIPLVCVGETARQDEISAAVADVAVQVQSVMAAVPGSAEVVLAYEPVWAIGAAQPAAPEYVVAVTRGIRELECVRTREGAVRILYGGSAGPGLFEKLKDGVDGLFLGRFAHDPEQFVRTIREVSEA
ncbi:hypothetical protein PgNI_10249 [Pyricularia grisea]|uniref:Triosephosphate isomerase n=1 Tax=Pyricularia grisea TaxID=148305 RepID=A0A6P8AYT9_PYRGI|nr:hypothetical protein PgNI_10249 [Pyricularia grisea]TLD07507.1 hypothetical protein PgNI_10249 [Pyricularia grisea]